MVASNEWHGMCIDELRKSTVCKQSWDDHIGIRVSSVVSFVIN